MPLNTGRTILHRFVLSKNKQGIGIVEEKKKTEAACRSVFKNKEYQDIKKQFTQKWTEIINNMEKNRGTI